MKKILVVVCVVVLVLVSSVAICFADDISAGVYVPVSSVSGFSSDYVITFDFGGYKIGQYSNGEFVVDEMIHDTFVSLSVDVSGSNISIYTVGTDEELIATFSSGTLTHQYYSIQVLSDSAFGITADLEAFESLFTPASSGGGVISSILSSVSSFFSPVLVFATGIIAWMTASWLAVIPLVLFVLVALYGIFRHLFKGV